eukprot:TRINITY_DN3067_c0_g1_i1.p1 TRINITY_DN3067_c0_g1~~TRINITY_DN3067_c0_g1_i1.p1  ORF type:complete len:255 (-),score=104.24 TRINITY_DN3067_c0_g1_i1:186-950(-)
MATNPNDNDTKQFVDQSKSQSSCPVMYKNPKTYNVYNQVIDPTNQMPPPNQQKHPDQKYDIPTERVRSSIPKAGSFNNWYYPSPQMFYNALKGKGKGEDVDERDVPITVKVHNSVNERTWKEIQQWEAMYSNICSDPRLLRFMGRPHDLSPKARIKTLLGYPIPFDRHDWFVDRCGKEVRYVIDYYYMPNSKQQDKSLENQTSKNIVLDIRPAADTILSIADRVRMSTRNYFLNNTINNTNNELDNKNSKNEKK